MARTTTQLAQDAYTELNLQREMQGLKALGRTHYERSLSLVTTAYEVLEARRSGYDPQMYAPELAEEAVIEYIKSRLLGQSQDVYQPYLFAVRRWEKKAANIYQYEDFLRREAEEESS